MGKLLAFFGKSLLLKNLLKSLLLLLRFLLLLHLVLHFHELLDLHALFDLLFSLALLLCDALLFKALSLSGCELVLLEPSISKIVLLLTISDSFPLFDRALVGFDVPLALFPLKDLIVLLVAPYELLFVFVFQFEAFGLSHLGPISGLLSLQPI